MLQIKFIRSLILLAYLGIVPLCAFSQSKLQGAGKASKVGTTTTTAQKKATTPVKSADGKKATVKVTAPAKRNNESRYESTAYMEITGVKFGNVDNDNHIIDNYGNKLYASEMKYLKPQLTYKGLSTSEKEITLYVKILKEDGTLEKGDSSPEGYTYKYDFTVKPGSNQTATLIGWGRNSGGSYSPGQYTFEIWYKDKAIYQDNIRLYSGATPLINSSIFKINRIAFGSEDKAGNTNIKMGETLYEGDVKYLVGNLYYEGLYSNNQKVTLYMRIFFPSGGMSSGNESPIGFSYKRDVTIKPGSNVYKISGWGNDNGTTYKEGKHKYEIWLDGEKIYETYFTVYKKSSSVLLVEGSTTSIDDFFPIWGVTLGKTTWKQAEDAGNVVKKWKDGPDRYMDIGTGRITFWDHKGEGKFTQIYWTHTEGDFPSHWKSKGFSWDNSYNTWLSTFRSLGFTINVTKEPETKYYDNRKTLSADVQALSKDGLLRFDLDFDYGKDGHYTSSPKSLYSIRIRYLGN